MKKSNTATCRPPDKPAKLKYVRPELREIKLQHPTAGKTYSANNEHPNKASVGPS